MKVGDIVRHKLSPEVGRLRIDKINETMATCYRLDGPGIYVSMGERREQWQAICSLENLELW